MDKLECVKNRQSQCEFVPLMAVFLIYIDPIGQGVQCLRVDLVSNLMKARQAAPRFHPLEG